MYDIHSGAVRGFQKGGGEISNVVVSNATRPEGPRLRRDRVQRCTGKFSRGAQARPEGPRIRAEARRAEAAGDGARGKGCPLPLGKKIFDFRTSLDPFLDHFLQFFSFLSHLFTYKLSFHFFPAATPPSHIILHPLHFPLVGKFSIIEPL